MGRASFVSVLLAALASSAVYGQQPDPSQLSASERTGAIRAALSRAPDPTDGPAISSPGPKVVLEATTEDNVATARIAHIWNNFWVQAIFRGKIGEGDEVKELADLDGIRAKSSFKGSVMWTHWGINPGDLVSAPCGRYRTEIETKRRNEIRQTLITADRATIEKEFPGALMKEEGAMARAQAREAELERSRPERIEKEFDSSFKPIVCSLVMLRNLAREAAAKAEPNSPAAQIAAREIVELGRLLDPGTVFFVGGDVTVAPESFEYVTLAETVTDGKQDHTSRAFSGRASLLTKHNITYTAAFTWEKSWKPGSETDLCQPAGPVNVAKCATAVVGEPQEMNKRKGTLGLRWFPSPRFAVDLRVNHDFEEGATGVEFPIYFLQSPEGGLAGGVNVGYHMDKQEFTAVLFVGGLSTLLPK